MKVLKSKAEEEEEEVYCIW